MSNENRLLTSVHTVTQMLSSTVNPDEGLKLMLDAAVQATDAEGGSILLHDPERSQLWFHHVLGGEAHGPRLAANFGLYGVSIRDDEGIAGQVFQSQMPQIENNVKENPQHAKRIDEQSEFETRNLITIPLRYPGGAPFGVMQLVNKRDGDFTDEDLTVLDIVANISAMNAQNAHLAQEARKSKALGYLGRVVHDVSNKVTRLIGPVEMLSDTQEKALAALTGDEAETTRQDLRERLETITAGLRDLLRYTDFMTATVAGEPLELRSEENDLIEVTERQLSLLDDGAEGVNKVNLVRNFEKDSLVFPFDSFLLERAIFNLVNNALKATKAGDTITVGIREEDGYAVLEVKDTGLGMPPYVLARILKGNAIGPKAGGTGLSATIVREVMEMHGGVLEGESVEGMGTTFRLRLPLAL